MWPLEVSCKNILIENAQRVTQNEQEVGPTEMIPVRRDTKKLWNERDSLELWVVALHVIIHFPLQFSVVRFFSIKKM